MVYVLKGQVSDDPVYVVYPENGDNKKTRMPHQNSLLLLNDFHVKATMTTSQLMKAEKTKEDRKTDIQQREHWRQ